MSLGTLTIERHHPLEVVPFHQEVIGLLFQSATTEIEAMALDSRAYFPGQTAGIRFAGERDPNPTPGLILKEIDKLFFCQISQSRRVQTITCHAHAACTFLMDQSASKVDEIPRRTSHRLVQRGASKPVVFTALLQTISTAKLLRYLRLAVLASVRLGPRYRCKYMTTYIPLARTLGHNRGETHSRGEPPPQRPAHRLPVVHSSSCRNAHSPAYGKCSTSTARRLPTSGRRS